MASEIEDIYRLTPAQEALLLHRLQAGGDDFGFLQMSGILSGRIDSDGFAKAWERCMARHPVLRSSIHWEGLSHPVQIVRQSCRLDIKEKDWRGKGEAEQAELFGRLREKDRRLGIDLECAPLMRLQLLRTGRRETRFLWTCHHILLDGWSSAMVLNEVLQGYHRLSSGDGSVEEPPRRYRDYVRWVRGFDTAEMAGYWKDRGLAPPPPLAPQPRGGVGRRTVGVVLQKTVAAAIDGWSRANRVTPSSLFAGCWSLVLGEELGVSSPAFGLTVSGRSVPFDGIEGMVGMFANTLPLQVAIDRGEGVSSWFRSLFAHQQELQEQEHVSLDQILEWVGGSARSGLFDTLLAFANYPIEAGRRSVFNRGLSLIDFAGDLTSAYPLSIAIKPGAETALEAIYDPEVFDEARVRTLLERYRKMIDDIVTAPASAKIGELIARDATLSDAAETTQAAGEGDGQGAYAAPENATEAVLAGIWRDLVGVDRIGRDDNFFDLGGRSLAIPRMMNRIGERLGADLPLGELFRSPTIAKLAEQVDRRRQAAGFGSAGGLVEIQPGHRRPVLFATAGGVGVEEELLLYGALAPNLGCDLPIAGFGSGSLDERPPESFEALVERNLTALRERQAQGPYVIIGECLSGVVAFEMARRLEGAGERVARLILLDAKCPDDSDLEWQRGEGYRELVNIQGAKRAEKIQAYYLNVLGHRPGVFDGPVDIVLVKESRDRFGETLGWKPHLRGPYRVHLVPGDHDSYIREHNAALAGRLATVLADVLATL